VLLGLYRPTEGLICYDGQDLAELDVSSFRPHSGSRACTAERLTGLQDRTLARSYSAWHKYMTASVR
jgi:hypothetical protein